MSNTGVLITLLVSCTIDVVTWVATYHIEMIVHGALTAVLGHGSPIGVH